MPGTLSVAGILVAGFVTSNRMSRWLAGSTAYFVGRFDRKTRESVRRAATRVDEIRTSDAFVDMLVWVTSRTMGGGPVTLFLLSEDREAFKPVASNLLNRQVDWIPLADPLARMLRSTRFVHYFRGRSDDLQNAPILVSNGHQLDDCQATCAIPLRREGKLEGFLLCGLEASRFDGMSRIETLARSYVTHWPHWSRRCSEAAEASHGKTRRSEEGARRTSAVVSARLRETKLPVCSPDREITAHAGADIAEPQASGMLGGFETTH